MRLRFAHWLSQRVGYENLLVTHRATLHGRIAEAIESRVGTDGWDDLRVEREAIEREARAGGADDALELSLHLEAAGRRARAAAWRVVGMHALFERGQYVAVLASRLPADSSPSVTAAAMALKGRTRTRTSGARAAVDDLDASLAASAGLSGRIGALLRSRALTARAYAFVQLGRLDEAGHSASAAIREAESEDCAVERASALSQLGIVEIERSRLEDALRLLNEALDARRRTGELRAVAGVLHNIAVAHDEAGRSLEALELHRESLALYRELGDRWGEGTALTGLASDAFALERIDEAEAWTAEALRLSYEVGYRSGIAVSEFMLGACAWHRGDHAGSLGHMRTSLVLRGELDNRLGQASALVAIGHVLEDSGDLAGALDAFNRGLALARATGVPPIVSDALSSASLIHARQGDAEQALALARQAVEAAEPVERAGLRARADLALARARLDSDAARAAVARTRAEARPANVAGALVVLAELLHARHEDAAALDALAEAEKLSSVSGHAPSLREIASLRAELENPGH